MEGRMKMADQAEQLRLKSLQNLMPERASRKDNPSPGSRVIAVSSGKGGVGKTSVVINLSLALAQLGCRVIIIDADLGLANIDVMINTPAPYSLADVVSGERSVKEVIIKGPLGVKIVPGGTGLFDMANLDQARRRILLDKLSDLEEDGDFIIIDTAAGISRNVINFVLAADDFILITTPEPTALTDAYGLLKILSEKGFRKRSQIVVNSTRNLQQGRRAFNNLKRVAGRYLPGLELSYLGEIQYDPAVSAAVHEFVPFVIGRPQSSASAAVSRIAWRLASGGAKEQYYKKGIAVFVERLRGIICD